MADQKLSELTELAATPANDDEVYIRDVSEAAAQESKRITIANLLAGVGGATKEFFLPITIVKHSGSAQAWGDFPVIKLDAAGEYIHFTFKCPHDFTTLTHCKVVFLVKSTPTIDWTAITDFGANGEAYNIHSDSDTADDLALTEVISEIDISGALTGLVADDYVGVKFTLDAISVQYILVIGLVFKYS